jgi:hypothetical protein
MKRYVVSIMTLLTTLMPSFAFACPQCAGRSDGGVLGAVILGIMILSPFIVAILVFPVLRRLAAPVHGNGLDRVGKQEETG